MSVKIAVTLRGGYYVCALGYAGKPHTRGADEGKISPIFITKEEAVLWAKRHGHFVHGM